MSSGRLDGRVAFITGAARGQGRSHALRLAGEGADIVAVDACTEYTTTDYVMPSPDELAETARLVEALGRRAVTSVADVRAPEELREAARLGAERLGGIDIVVANAGICVLGSWDEVTDEVWKDTIDTNLTGAWNTMSITAPYLIEGGGGSIICTGSTCGVQGVPFFAPYVASKHGLSGVAKTMANELARHAIRVNVVHPTGVETELTNGLSRIGELIERDPRIGVTFGNALDVERLQPEDVSDAVLFLASDESKYMTGTDFVVDAGCTNF
ncbi:mycofactocin-coupled SDR family oxidoreductase [Gordonia humi]|uniref:SDR family mycofactocin-dependent oxidoreductase n=1 Tax=Gordonia humi TaxID=686429 RepID=A0A840EUL7_9ACTN|nr:mycofactocin-coupled SDR family oxidoreductase [Gordonia humi]MBB4133536.1 SDR family mycofactocin-dependent oxidoreductase [Gordonia humi]